jgi:hypothetical protein
MTVEVGSIVGCMVWIEAGAVVNVVVASGTVCVGGTGWPVVGVDVHPARISIIAAIEIRLLR